MAMVDGDPTETERREELTRYVSRPLATSTLVNGLRSALEVIAKESDVLLEKAKTAQFMDRDAYSGRVARIIETLRRVVTRYQVSENYLVASSTTHAGGQISQQPAIRNQIIDLIVRILRLASTCCADDRFFYQVVFLCALETSRSNSLQFSYHDFD